MVLVVFSVVCVVWYCVLVIRIFWLLICSFCFSVFSVGLLKIFYYLVGVIGVLVVVVLSGCYLFVVVVVFLNLVGVFIFGCI